MKVYVASSWRNEQLDEVVATLILDGHEIHDFREVSGFQWSDIDSDWQNWTESQYREALEHSLAQEGYDSDMEGIMWADAVLLVQPCGPSAHLELGWAMGNGKWGIVLLDFEPRVRHDESGFMLIRHGEPDLMYKMADRVCANLAEVRIALQEMG